MEKEAGLLAVGCQGSELSIWNVHTREKVFQAKGAKPNKLGLMDLPWNSALTFVPGAAGKKLFVGTGYHKLRVYDVAQARPVSNVEFGEARISDIAACPDGELPSCLSAPCYLIPLQVSSLLAPPWHHDIVSSSAPSSVSILHQKGCPTLKHHLHAQDRWQTRWHDCMEHYIHVLHAAPVQVCSNQIQAI